MKGMNDYDGKWWHVRHNEMNADLMLPKDHVIIYQNDFKIELRG